MILLKPLVTSKRGHNMFNSILVVCTGNVCRSPIAERLLREQLIE
ncbi:hypothetical protein DMH17_15875 [Raoultella planticola]|nr:hypothetical protein [Raoultella planticola]